MAIEHDVTAEQRRAVDRAVDHVLGRLGSQLDLAGLAVTAGYSRWHFQRVFTAIMGESPTAFVARARLERAVAIARAEPRRPWSDIAHEVGFATPAQLSRAFTQRFGRPARTWDRAAPLVDRDARPGRADESTSIAGAINVRIDRIPGHRFAYRRVHEPYAPGRLAAAWDEVATWCSSVGRLVGMSWDDPATVPLERCRYDLGIVLDDDMPTPDGASERWMPSTWAAVVSVDGDIGAVDAAWEHLHRVWLPASQRRRAALPSIERFRADPRPSWERWHLDCVLPVTAVG